MRKRNRTLAGLLALLATLTVSLIVAHSAGGGIEGKVTDPKGAVVVGASVTISDEEGQQKFTAVTDQQGHYKIEGIPAGVYAVVISAPGFNDARKDAVTITEGASMPLDLRLEVAPIEANVNVVAGQTKANTDPVYQQLRQQGKSAPDFSGPYATVNNLILLREGSAFNLRSGELYFLAPVEGRYTAAVFIGDGEFALKPPTETEQNSLKIFTDEPFISEQFMSLTLRFTDKTFDEVKNSPAVKMGAAGPQASRGSPADRHNEA